MWKHLEYLDQETNEISTYYNLMAPKVANDDDELSLDEDDSDNDGNPNQANDEDELSLDDDSDSGAEDQQPDFEML